MKRFICTTNNKVGGTASSYACITRKRKPFFLERGHILSIPIDNLYRTSITIHCMISGHKEYRLFFFLRSTLEKALKRGYLLKF